MYLMCLGLLPPTTVTLCCLTPAPSYLFAVFLYELCPSAMCHSTSLTFTASPVLPVYFADLLAALSDSASLGEPNFTNGDCVSDLHSVAQPTYFRVAGDTYRNAYHLAHASCVHHACDVLQLLTLQYAANVP